MECLITAEYRTYLSARDRCRNPKTKVFPEYGGRGIEFRFTSFEEFYAELGPRPNGRTLDRINNEGHYEIGNVRWATPKEQANNRRNNRKQEGLNRPITRTIRT